MTTVFISHSSSDDATVNRIFDALTDAGMSAWVDHHEGITYGANWSRAIQAAADSCACGLFVLSPDAAESEYCEAEWNAILDQKKMLYIAQIKPIDKSDVPLRLRIIHRADLTTDFDGELAKLIAAMMGRATSTAPAAPVAKAPPKISGPFRGRYWDVPLTGRDADLKDVRALLADGGHRVTAIMGIGGVGKTRLAAEIVRLSDARGGVVWHEIQDYTAPNDLTLLLRDHLGLELTAAPGAIWAEAGRRGVLIVLDNAEECRQQAGYAALLEGLDLSAGARVLMTSRAVWPELRGCQRHTLRPLSLDAAAELVCEFARYEPGDFSVDGYERAIAEAAHRHPRLIEYALRWAGNDGPDEALRLLATLQGREVEAALDDIVRRTARRMAEEDGGPEALAALRRLAVCRGGFTGDAAKALIGDSPALPLLRRWGLASLVDEQTKRHEIDPLVIAAVGEDESARRAHYDYYKALARQHHERQDYLGLDVESANLEAAFEWAMRSGDGDAAYWLQNACQFFLANRGRFEQNMDWLKRSALVLEGSPDEYTRAAAQVSLGNAYNDYPFGDRRENMGKAVDAYEEALRFATPERAPLNYAMTQNNLGTAYGNLSEIEDRAGNLRRAVAAFEEALRFYTPERAPLAYAMTQNNLGNAYRNLAGIEDRAENLRRAVAAFEEALRFWTPQTAPLDYARAQNNLGLAYADLAGIEDRAGNFAKAVAAYEEALRFRTPERAPLAYAMTQNNLGTAYGDLARIEDRAEDKSSKLQKAIAAFEEALRFWTPERAPLYYAGTQRNLGIARRDMGDLPAAVACWREAERFFRRMGYTAEADLMLRWIAGAEGGA